MYIAGVNKMLKKNTLIASENEYDELQQDLKLIIHEFIDKYDKICKDAVKELVDDLMTRDDIESDGHTLDKEKVKENLIDLADTFCNIYEADGEPRGLVDIFKFAIANTLYAYLTDSEYMSNDENDSIDDSDSDFEETNEDVDNAKCPQRIEKLDDDDYTKFDQFLNNFCDNEFYDDNFDKGVDR